MLLLQWHFFLNNFNTNIIVKEVDKTSVFAEESTTST